MREERPTPSSSTPSSAPGAPAGSPTRILHLLHLRPLVGGPWPGAGAWTVLTLALVVTSRWAAFPASVWDQDEAIFARALVELDLAAFYPHPPFFPAWIAAGKALLAVAPTLEPSLALCLISATLSVWMVFPLTAFWRLALERHPALFAALIFLLLPVPWLLAGRAYTSTAATAFLVAGAAFLLAPSPARSEVLMGSLYLGLCALTRPQWLPLVLVVGLWAAVTDTRRWLRLAPILVPGGLLLVAGAALAGLAGGPGELAAIVGRHGQSHFDALARFPWHPGRIALLRTLGHPLVGVAWLAVSLEGAVLLPRRRAPLALLAAATVLFLLFLQNQTLLRYTVPYLALTSGLVVTAIQRTLGGKDRSRLACTVLLVILSAITAGHLPEYHGRASPVVRAMERIVSRTRSTPGAHVVAHRTMALFIDLSRVQGQFGADVTWDHELRQSVIVANAPLLLAVYDRDRGDWSVTGSRVDRFTCDPWFRERASPRLLDLVVVEGQGSATFVDPARAPARGPGE